MKPSKHKMTVLSQVFKLIPRNSIPKIANDFGINRQSRGFSPTSHVLALVFGQLTHALGLNDICDTLRNRHIYQDSLLYDKPQKKGKNREWVFSENDLHKLKQGGRNDNFKELWDGSEKNVKA